MNSPKKEKTRWQLVDPERDSGEEPTGLGIPKVPQAIPGQNEDEDRSPPRGSALRPGFGIGE
jgi:hypothetical protein